MPTQGAPAPFAVPSPALETRRFEKEIAEAVRAAATEQGRYLAHSLNTYGRRVDSAMDPPETCLFDVIKSGESLAWTDHRCKRLLFTLAEGLEKRQVVQSHIHVSTGVMRYVARSAGPAVAALRTQLANLEAYDCLVGPESYFIVISYLHKWGDHAAVCDTAHEMLRKRITPNHRTFQVIVAASSKHDPHSTAKFASMANKLHGVPLCSYMLSSLIRAHGALGEEAAAMKCWQDAVSKGVPIGLNVYHALLGASRSVRSAKKVWRVMRATQQTPTQHTAVLMLRVCISTRAPVSTGQQFVTDLEEAGVEPGVLVWTTLINLCTVHDDLAAATALWRRIHAAESMQKVSVEELVVALLGTCAACAPSVMDKAERFTASHPTFALACDLFTHGAALYGERDGAFRVQQRKKTRLLPAFLDVVDKLHNKAHRELARQRAFEVAKQHGIPFSTTTRKRKPKDNSRAPTKAQKEEKLAEEKEGLAVWTSP